MREPVLADVVAAAARIRPYLPATPLRRAAGLDDLVGAEVYVKLEHHLPTGAFKVRGGVNLVARLDAERRRRGLVAASTGNHGQSVAFAARLFGAGATIFAPEGSNPGKVAAMRELGAEVVLHGGDFDEARAECERVAAADGRRYVHSGDEPDLIAGVGTHTLEVLGDLPETEVIVVPVGGGSGAAGACIVAKALRPEIQVIGVQSAQAPSAQRSWRSREAVAEPSRTWVEGLSTGTPFELPQQILRRLLDDFVLVDDADISTALVTLIERARVVVEGAAAASLAGALAVRERLAGRRVVLILSGGNISRAQLASVLALG